MDKLIRRADKSAGGVNSGLVGGTGPELLTTYGSFSTMPAGIARRQTPS